MTEKSSSEAQHARNVKGGTTRWSGRTVEERQAHSRRMRIAGAVKTVTTLIDELTPEQLDALASAVGARVLR